MMDSTVSSNHSVQWNEQGYLLLPKAVDAATCDAVNAEVDRITGVRRQSQVSDITVDVLHGRLMGSLLKAVEAPDDVFSGPFKVNNLFVESTPVCDAMFNHVVADALRAILGSPAVAINSLNFVWGSQQPPHIDSWYMPPPKSNSLAVMSLCLEDVNLDAGPLFYYPGSHLIPPYRFSHGGLHAVDAEMPACRAYLDAEIANHKLTKEVFLGIKGDVFIWHCQMLHGGSQINDARRTRRSLVAHFWGLDSVPPSDVKTLGDHRRYLSRDYYNKDTVQKAAPGIINSANVAPENATRLMPNAAPTEASLPPNAVMTAASPLSSNAALTGASPPPNAALAKAPSTPMTILQTPSTHQAFQTWEGTGESLESVEARIHDGAPISQLHERADGYLTAFEQMFPHSIPRQRGVMMEVGSGLGYIMQAALRRYHPARIVGLDIAAGMIAHARQRLVRDRIIDPSIEFAHYDGVTMPIDSNSIDHVYSVAALQHAPRPYCFRAMVEAYRVVKPKGYVWIHLLSYAHFRDHITPALFLTEVDQQIQGRVGHWHHYYSGDELESVARHGIGADSVELREHMGSLFLCMSKNG